MVRKGLTVHNKYDTYLVFLSKVLLYGNVSELFEGACKLSINQLQESQITSSLEY